jgi:hypothetical protein
MFRITDEFVIRVTEKGLMNCAFRVRRIVETGFLMIQVS